MSILYFVIAAVLMWFRQTAYGAISEASHNSIYVNCIRQSGKVLRQNRFLSISDEGLEWSCMQSFLWQTAAQREAPRNLTQQQTVFLRTLVGDPRSTRAWQIFKKNAGPLTETRVTGQPITPRRPGPARRRTTRPRFPATTPPTIRPNNRVFNRFSNFRSPQKSVPSSRTLGRSARSKRSSHDRLRRSLAGLPRKEYRAMTDTERNALHTALNLAKSNTILSPNVYDFVASLHSGVLANGAHDGPAFLPFHRIYILIMDLVICYFDNTNSVRLPFWDNTLDNELPNPTLSIMWHSTFAGEGNGFVSNGPFGSWSTLNGPSIRRNIGSGGSLMSEANVNAVLTRSQLTEISKPTAAFQYDLERYHGLVHGWVGGDMSVLNTATNDPVFFMHHAFIDCIWQQFRDLQPGKGVNPNTDYPNTLQTYHRPTDSIGIVPSITNAQAVTAFYASFSRCEHPRCPKCGPYLECVNNRCVPVLSDEADPCPSCPGSSQSGYTGYQNSYCINGYCDTNQWAYIPVQITYNRPPDYDASGKYGSYPVARGRSRQKYDIYSPQGYTSTGIYTRRYERQDRSSRYRDCGCRQGEANSGAVYVQSYGVNYDGSYREYAIVDRRYAISLNTAYVAVRNPRQGASQAYVNVYDDCGRLCRPTCWNRKTRRWVPCSGAITLTTGGRNRGYGNSYEDATYQVWDYSNEAYPTYSQNNIYLNYFCDYTGTWPWTNYRG